MELEIQPKTQSSEKINYLHFVKMYPEHIKSIHCDQELLLVARETYTQIYRIAQSKDKIFFDQLIRLEQSEHVLRIQNSIVIITPFEIKICDFQNWKTHPFANQLTGISFIEQKLYTHHEDSTLIWDIQNMNYQSVAQKDIPFHKVKDGIRGYSKTLKGQFTYCHEFKNHLYVGQSTGNISIYQTKFLTLVKKIRKHEGPILSIISCNQTNSVYVTGCDSKIVCIKNINDDFVVTSSCRGQSHDILSLCLLNPKYLVSGGLSTDICYYKLQNGDFTGEHQNRVSLPSKKLIDSENENNLMLINQGKQLQLWKYDTIQNNSEFLIKFQGNSPITQIALSSNQKWIAYSNSTQTNILKLTENRTLKKHLTLQAALFIKFVDGKQPQLIFVGQDFFVYSINLKTKQTEELFKIQEIHFISNFQLYNNMLLVASKLQEKIIAYNLKTKQKINQLNHKFHLVELNSKGLLLVDDFTIHLYLDSGQQLQLSIPLRKIRFGGNFPSKRKFWYGIGDGKIILISNLFTKNEKYIKNNETKIKKKIRIKNLKRIYQVIQKTNQLNLIPVDFNQMVSKIQNPLIGKKIL